MARSPDEQTSESQIDVLHSSIARWKRACSNSASIGQQHRRTGGHSTHALGPRLIAGEYCLNIRDVEVISELTYLSMLVFAPQLFGWHRSKVEDRFQRFSDEQRTENSLQTAQSQVVQILRRDRRLGLDFKKRLFFWRTIRSFLAV